MLTAMTMNDIERELMPGGSAQGLSQKKMQTSCGVINEIEMCLSAANVVHDSLSLLEKKANPFLTDDALVDKQESAGLPLPSTSTISAMLRDLRYCIQAINSRVVSLEGRVDL